MKMFQQFYLFKINFNEMASNFRFLYNQKISLDEKPSIDQFGFIVSSIPICDSSDRLLKLQWYQIIDQFEANKSKFKAMIQKRRLLQRGIPMGLRSRTWKYLLNSTSFYIVPEPKSRNIKALMKLTGLFEPKSLDFIKKETNKYLKMTNKISDYEFQIHVDIQRTFRQHSLFNITYGVGQCELFNVLTAFANTYPKIGYCQGLNDIAAILLMQFVEKDSFEMLELLISKNKIEGLFDKGLTLVPDVIKTQRCIFYKLIPKILFYMESSCENVSIHLIEWYLTLFSRFNIKLTIRIWDFLFFYRFNVLYYFAAAILNQFSDVIQKYKDDELIQAIKSIEKEDIDEKLIVDEVVKFLEETGYELVDKC